MSDAADPAVLVANVTPSESHHAVFYTFLSVMLAFWFIAGLLGSSGSKGAGGCVNVSRGSFAVFLSAAILALVQFYFTLYDMKHPTAAEKGDDGTNLVIYHEKAACLLPVLGWAIYTFLHTLVVSASKQRRFIKGASELMIVLGIFFLELAWKHAMTFKAVYLVAVLMICVGSIVKSLFLALYGSDDTELGESDRFFSLSGWDLAALNLFVLSYGLVLLACYDSWFSKNPAHPEYAHWALLAPAVYYFGKQVVQVLRACEGGEAQNWSNARQNVNATNFVPMVYNPIVGLVAFWPAIATPLVLHEYANNVAFMLALPYAVLLSLLGLGVCYHGSSSYVALNKKCMA